ncbi:6-carboxytetrahydropterin synthase [Candidatus Kapabacteria bacterium]|nr:6-carboxytetrahydropterin synthase [Candidatus Kapabacteria bacterium]
MVYVTRRTTFSASHRLFNPNWTDEKNQEVFDKCNNPNGHGHNYVLEVTVGGIPDPETGYVIDLKVLKNIIKEKIEKEVDHKHLNYDVDFLSGIIPTVENIVVAFWNILKESLTEQQKLIKLKLWETESNIAEYYGEDANITSYK